jgi:hypothetical protein
MAKIRNYLIFLGVLIPLDFLVSGGVAMLLTWNTHPFIYNNIIMGGVYESPETFFYCFVWFLCIELILFKFLEDNLHLEEYIEKSREE